MRIHTLPLFLAIAMLVTPCAVAQDDHKAAPWLALSDKLGDALTKQADEGDEENLYELPELYYRLVIYQAQLGNKDQAKKLYKKLQKATKKVYDYEGGEYAWTKTYLPGPALAIGSDVKITLPDSALEHAFAVQIEAETYHHLGQKDKYQDAIDRIIKLLPDAQKAAFMDADEYEYTYTGTIFAWYGMKMCRDFKDLDSARKIAAFAWNDDCEKGGTLALLAQLEWLAGNKDKAKELTTQALRLIKAAEAKEIKEKKLAEEEGPAPGEDPDEFYIEYYMADFETNLPELFVALYLTHGLEKALQTTSEIARDDMLWHLSAYAHTATILRRSGDHEAAQAIAKRGAALMFDPEIPPTTFDVMHLCRELTMQGKIKEAEAFFKRFSNPAIHAFGSLGIAQALLEQQ